MASGVGEGKPAGGIVLAPELGRHCPSVGQLAAQPGSLGLGQLLEGGAEVRLLRCCNLGLSAELAALSPACSLRSGQEAPACLADLVQGIGGGANRCALEGSAAVGAIQVGEG